MTKSLKLDELKLRSKIFSKKSAEAVQILNGRHLWYEFPIDHPVHLRQFIYWLNFKNPTSWYVHSSFRNAFENKRCNLCEIVIQTMLSPKLRSSNHLQFVTIINPLVNPPPPEPSGPPNCNELSHSILDE